MIGSEGVGSRRSVRVLLLDESDRVLLVRFWDGDESWWCTPGGGIDPDESDESAARRELREEVGGAKFELGPCIWTRRQVGLFRGSPFDQSERIYLGRVAALVPHPSPDVPVEHEREDIRWWTVDELLAADAVFAPRGLPVLVHKLLTDGPPAQPVDVGV